MKQQPTFSFWDVGMSFVPEPRARLYDHYAGIAELAEVPWGTSGVKLADNIVLVCSRKPDPFRFAFRYGGAWHEYALVSRDDSGVLALDAAGRITHYDGESPMQRIKRARREAAERAEHP